MSIKREHTARKYFSLVMRLNALSAFLISLSWVVGFALLKTPVVAILSSVSIASIALVLSSVLRFYVDKKYKQVTARRADYILSNIPLYILVVVPVFILLSISHMLSELGILIILYIDGVILLIFTVVSKLPRSFLFGGKMSPLSNGALLSRARALANRMGVQVVDLYTIGWKKFKVANAVQMGPHKFSILISDHLIESLSPAEVDAVVAHELAHAKRRHVLKIVTTSLCFSMVGVDLLWLIRSAEVLAPWHLVLFFAGLVSVFGGNMFCIPYITRKFELEADYIAVKTLDNGKTMISALRKLAELNLIPKKKPRMSWGLTHPSASQRIETIQKVTGCSIQTTREQT